MTWSKGVGQHPVLDCALLLCQDKRVLELFMAMQGIDVSTMSVADRVAPVSPVLFLPACCMACCPGSSPEHLHPLARKIQP